jgi:hypothetical protein
LISDALGALPVGGGVGDDAGGGDPGGDGDGDGDEGAMSVAGAGGKALLVGNDTEFEVDRDGGVDGTLFPTAAVGG